jgi:hypothetical protein
MEGEREGERAELTGRLKHGGDGAVGIAGVGGLSPLTDFIPLYWV